MELQLTHTRTHTHTHTRDLSHYSFWFQSYQLAEDLGRAFSDRTILQTFINVEATVPAGSLKVRDTLLTLWETGSELVSIHPVYTGA